MKKQKNKNLIIGGMKFKRQTFMTNDKLKQIIYILVATIVILFTTLAIVVTNHRTKQPVPQPKTIIVSDTITNIIYDTVFINHYKTVKLQLTDTLIIDSVRIDSIFVQVPISVYQLDTVFETDSTRLDLHIINSGFDVKLDSLYYRLEYRQAPPVVPKKNYFREHFRFGVGVSAGYGFFTKQPDIFVGLGFYYCF